VQEILSQLAVDVFVHKVQLLENRRMALKKKKGRLVNPASASKEESTLMTCRPQMQMQHACVEDIL
jgi:hypothetical protein